MRKLFILATMMALAISLTPAPAAAACNTDWGSKRERVDRHPDAEMLDARAGEHACYDRIVFEMEGGKPGFVVRYVDKFVPSADGKVHELRGNATLHITMLGVRAHDEDGNPTYKPAKRAEMLDVDGFRTFRQVFWGGTFEATTNVGVGTRARLPFRVFVLDGPGSHKRLVVDVAHRWT